MSTSSLVQSTTTINTILGGAIQLMQPVKGYRASIDPIFLASSIQAKATETILDLGTGAGTAMLALAHRIPEVKITGLEIQREMVRLASHNIKLNNFHDRLEVIQGDLLMPPPRLAASSFSHIMVNPPYFESESSVHSSHATKAWSNQDQGTALETWVKFAHRMLKPKGSATFIFAADRLDDLMAALYGKFGDITLFPLWPKAGRQAKRFLIRGRKSIQSPSHILSGLIVHGEKGEYTAETEGILKRSLALDL